MITTLLAPVHKVIGYVLHSISLLHCVWELMSVNVDECERV